MAGIKRVKRHRRGASYVALLVAFAALGVWASYALAGTKGGGGQAVVNVEKHNDDCGDTQGKKVIGTDTFKLSGNTLSVVHKLHGADPGNSYVLDVYDGVTCEHVGYLGKFKVDGSGDGSKSGTVDVAGWSGTFFTCDYNYGTELYDCGLIGKVGKNQLAPSTSTV